jgi:hypothetical protein
MSKSTPNAPANLVSIEFIRLPCQLFDDVSRDLLWKEKEPVKSGLAPGHMETTKIALIPVDGFHPRFT